MNRPVLDVRHLEMIAMLLETPRVTEAAEKLRITPSALSHRLREMERRLEVPLFLRVHKRLRPTPAADYLAQVARRLLADMTRAEDDVRKMASGLRHVVRLAVESSPLVRDAGARVLTMPEAVRSAADADIVRTDPLTGAAAALSAFDTQFEGGLVWNGGGRSVNSAFSSNALRCRLMSDSKTRRVKRS